MTRQGAHDLYQRRIARPASRSSRSFTTRHAAVQHLGAMGESPPRCRRGGTEAAQPARRPPESRSGPPVLVGVRFFFSAQAGLEPVEDVADVWAAERGGATSRRVSSGTQRLWVPQTLHTSRDLLIQVEKSTEQVVSLRTLWVSVGVPWGSSCKGAAWPRARCGR